MSKAILPPTLRTPQQIAAYLGTTESNLTNWRKRGQGPPYVRLTGGATGGTVRYRQSDVDAWLASRTRNALVADGGHRDA